ncbi:anti-phage ZorAB system protein ZorA [Azotobacter salinestris]|uniref:anti-phage ZorAB system protein ZorA n=1 Tax=Azotobacter salinestris TaxID=69964 RepID=UPI0032DF6FBA
MMEQLQHLWPDFGALTAGTTAGLSAIFWLFMLVIFAGACIALIVHALQFATRMGALQDLIKEQTSENLALNRREVRQQAEQLKERDESGVGMLWLEFDKTLVSSGSSDHSRLYSTLDAEHFFNARALAPGLTASRLLAATPSFLVAIGVLGTFVGLTVGLENLAVQSSDVEVLKSGIDQLIGGAAVAFMTSVWGVLFSLLLNFIEKMCERGALSRIQKLQYKIDALYPRLPAEQSLVHIADHSRESSAALQELHERIGNKLQESMTGLSGELQHAITDALNNIMAPAIQTLVDSAGNQSSQLMEQLVGNFMEGMTSAGREQGQLMQQAAADVNAAVTGMGERLNQLFQTLSEQQSRQLETTQQRSSQFESQLERISSLADQRQQQMEQRFGELMTGLGSQLESQLGSAQRRDEERQALFERLLAESRASQAVLLDKLSGSTQTQLQALAEASNEHHNNLEKVFSRLMTTLNAQLDAQMNTAEERERRRAARHEQQQAAALTQQEQLLGSLGQTSQQQIAAIAEAATQQQRSLESTVGKLLDRLNEQMTSHGQQAEERERARADHHEKQQAAALAQQEQLLGSLGQTSQQQIAAIAEAATQQQRSLESTVGKLLDRLNEQMTSHGQQAEERELQRQQRLNEQLEKMAEQQRALLEGIATAVQATQLQSRMMAEQHQQLLGRLQESTEAAATSSKHMRDSAVQLGALSLNLQKAAEVLGQRLETLNQSIEGASSQNAALAGQLRDQASTLSQLQTTLLESAQRFEQAAGEARNGFGEMKQYQKEFLADVRSEFTALGEMLRTQVEGIETQAEEWLRSYSRETGIQVDERMNQWNAQTQSFVTQMLAAVQAISNVVDELEGAR